MRNINNLNLNFASYAKAIKKGISKTTNIEITKLLLNLIVNDENVVNKNGEPYFISNYYVNKWINEHEDIPSPIKKAASSLDIISRSTTYFEENVLTALSPQKEDDTFATLLELINNDNTMSLDKKKCLLSLYEDNEIGEFLSETFLYALQKNNKTSEHKQGGKLNTPFTSQEEVQDEISKINALLKKIPKPIIEVPHDIIKPQEVKYTSELLAAYADEEGVEEITKENLDNYPKYKKNFQRQRRYYYAAESIRRSARDTFGMNEDDEFNLLIEETYDGIIDVHEEEYSSGFQRFNSVMKHVTTIEHNKSSISKIPGWIGPSEKKGFCHILVNKGVIKWVNHHE